MENIAFSSVPNSAAYRAIRRYAWKVCSSLPHAISSLPPLVNTSEREFVVSLAGSRESKPSDRRTRLAVGIDKLQKGA